MKIPQIQVDAIQRRLYEHRRIIMWVAALLIILVVVSWFVHLATSPSRYSGDSVWLSTYGIPDVELTIVHPTRLNTQQTGSNADVITVLARARSEDAIQSLDLIFPLQDEAVAFVNAQGQHIAGRLAIQPGYPDALPHDLLVAHGNTQWQGRLLRSYRVNVLPLMRSDGNTVAVPELAFQMRLESQAEVAIRTFSAFFFGVGMPYIVIAFIAFVALWVWWRMNHQKRLARERQLSALYGQLRQHIALERWQDARQEIRQVRLLQPAYRDVDELDALVSSAESAILRREKLYRIGIQAYENRDWLSAAQTFRAIEEENPFFRDIRFLKRTSELYLDLTSRDRSQRIAAARQLGEIGDLLDMIPLRELLGAHSDPVAQAAMDAFLEIGPSSFDVLLAGLAHNDSRVRERAYQLLEKMGQSIREQLLGALRSSEPRITAPVAKLLAKLGAREELAKALLWASEEHQEGIVMALVAEGIASVTVLIDTLLAVPPERQRLAVNALVALKSKVDIDRHIEQALHEAQNTNAKELLQRVLRASGAPFRVAHPNPPQPKALSSQSVARNASSKEPSKPRLFRRISERGRARRSQ